MLPVKSFMTVQDISSKQLPRPCLEYKWVRNTDRANQSTYPQPRVQSITESLKLQLNDGPNASAYYVSPSTPPKDQISDNDDVR